MGSSRRFVSAPPRSALSVPNNNGVGKGDSDGGRENSVFRSDVSLDGPDQVTGALQQASIQGACYVFDHYLFMRFDIGRPVADNSERGARDLSHDSILGITISLR